MCVCECVYFVCARVCSCAFGSVSACGPACAVVRLLEHSAGMQSVCSRRVSECCFAFARLALVLS